MIAGVDEQFHVRQFRKQLQDKVIDASTSEMEHAILLSIQFVIDDLIVHSSRLRSSIQPTLKLFQGDAIAPGLEIIVNDVKKASGPFIDAATNVVVTQSIVDEPFVVDPGVWLAVLFLLVIAARLILVARVQGRKKPEQENYRRDETNHS